MKGFRQNILDFEIIPTGNPMTFVFVDSSDYKDEQPDRPLLEVTLPGYDKYLIVNIKARSVNTFNSNTLGLTELLNNDCLVELPDGVYKLNYKICPYTANQKAKSIFRTTLLEQKLTDLYLIDDKKLTKQLAEIFVLIEGAKAIVGRDAERATQFYALATKLVDAIYVNIGKCCN